MKKKILLKHFYMIFKKCNKSFIYGCGSYLFDGKKYKYEQKMLEKQKLLFDLSKSNEKILEIGTYMGHSLLIMLMSNPKLKITAVDIDKTYSLSAINYLIKKFNNSKIKFFHNDSIDFLKKNNKSFDLYHIDGDHSYYKVFKEVILCLKSHKKNKIKILFDDYISIKKIVSSIHQNFKISKILIPNCIYKNCYIEFFYNKKMLNKFILNYYIIILLYFPKRTLYYFYRNLKKIFHMIVCTLVLWIKHKEKSKSMLYQHKVTWDTF